MSQRGRKQEEPVTEPVIEATPLGVDLTLLRRDPTVRELAFDYAEHRWVFRYRPVTWGEHWGAVERAWENVEGEPIFNVPQYYEELMLKMIVEIPGGGALTRTVLRELDSSVVARLASVIPSPLLDREVAEAKKD